jgi:hypothetical protein
MDTHAPQPPSIAESVERRSGLDQKRITGEPSQGFDNRRVVKPFGRRPQRIHASVTWGRGTQVGAQFSGQFSAASVTAAALGFSPSPKGDNILSDRTSQACVCRVAHDEPCWLFLGNPRCRKATRGHLRKALACHWPERFSRSLHEVPQRFNALATETAH